jgi:sucrose-6-phosphate hydrolase SacC (GH32 family)
MNFFKTLCLILLVFVNVPAQDSGKLAAKPLFRDPVYDGAADPVVVRNPKLKKWWMFYTNRRANVPDLNGVAWVHGTPIGIAESGDDGATWKYVGTADINLPESFGGKNATLWAPDVVREGGKWHMFLTVVPGIFDNWQHPRSIVRLTSKNLRDWKYEQTIQLASDRVIDAGLVKMPDDTWRMYYNNERDNKSIYLAESRDLKSWTEKGKTVGDKPGEGPKVFRWQGKYWMIVDQWRGLGVYRSVDGNRWTPQAENLLAGGGKGLDDEVQGQHADVLVSGGRAFLFYFTHPGRRAGAPRGFAEQRRSSIQTVELKLKDGWLAVDRDAPTFIKL